MTLHPPLWQQNQTYPARADRSVLDLAPWLGVLAGTDLAVTQRAGGANMSVDVAPGTVLLLASVGSRGKYLCRSDAVTNVAVGAAPGAGSSRIDLVVARVYDTEYGEATDSWTIEVVAGTAGPSPVAPAVPAGSIALARVAVGSEVAAITNGDITNTRSFAGHITASDYLPVVARDGQIVVGSNGQITVRQDGQWWSGITRDLFGLRNLAIATTAVSTGGTTVDTATLPQPSAPVSVIATVSGRGTTSDPSGSMAVWVEISEDGGSTWASSGNSGRAWGEMVDGRVPLSSTWAAPLTPSGVIHVRVRAIRFGGTAASFTGTLTVQMQPAGV